MPLDQVGERYAQNLFTTRLEQLTREFNARISDARQDFANRGWNAGNAGFYHTRMLDLNMERIEAIANAKADSLIGAYERARLPVDDAAVTTINEQALEWINSGVESVSRNAKQQIEQHRMPANMVQHVDTVIGHHLPGISSRLRLKLNRIRDEQLLDVQAANSRAAAAPNPSTPTVAVETAKESWRAAWWREWGTPAVIVAIIAMIVSVFTVEIRRRLGVDKQVPPAAVAAPAASPATAPQSLTPTVPSTNTPAPPKAKPATSTSNSSGDHVVTTVSHTPPPQESHETRDAIAVSVAKRVDWHDKNNWRQNLKVGMTQNQVRALFGEPDHVSTNTGMDMWYYGEIMSPSGGSIHFENGLIFGWDEPN